MYGTSICLCKVPNTKHGVDIIQADGCGGKRRGENSHEPDLRSRGEVSVPSKSHGCKHKNCVRYKEGWVELATRKAGT